ncbi:cation diffusion facilitator family transporter [Roseixanthobacter liquoris]|uniref:cation diffusion facilitator family transporter n=1 Tax=Roseixanthobacter liquoris TaxID=3119921 RepID=UPI00372C8F74
MDTLSPLRAPSATERDAERAILIAILLDLSLAVPYAIAALAIGSLAMLSEMLRGTLLLVVAIASLQTLRNLHRGRVSSYEYGIGKVERGLGFVIGVLLVMAAGFIVSRAFSEGGGEPKDGFWAAAAIVLVGYNFLVNVGPIPPLWKASRAGGSVIIQAQLRAHVAKAIASFPVVVCVVIDALSSDPAVARTADIIGGLIGAGFMAVVGASMVREALPDLLDRALDEPIQQKVNRALAAFFEDYDALLGVRTRRSGRVAHVEITIGFAPKRTMGEVSAILSQMEGQLKRDIPDIDAVLIARALP